MQGVDALIAANRNFDLLVLPNRNHDLAGTWGTLTEDLYSPAAGTTTVEHILGEQPAARYRMDTLD